MVSVSRADYENLLHSLGNSSTPAASTTAGAFVVSHGKSWMLDSGATAHITGTKSIFTSFSPNQYLLFVLLMTPVLR